MSVTVSGYIMTHCNSIYGFALRFCLSFSQIICISVELYCHWLYVYRYVSWSVFVSLSLFLSQCLNECSAILSQVICVRVRLLIHISLSLSLSLSVSVFGYIIVKSVCIRTSLDAYFFVSLCLWMRVAVSDYIMTDCKCKCTPLGSCVWLFFFFFLF